MITVLDKTLDWLRKQEDCFERNLLINTVENIKENIYNGTITSNIYRYYFSSTDPATTSTYIYNFNSTNHDE